MFFVKTQTLIPTNLYNLTTFDDDKVVIALICYYGRELHNPNYMCVRVLFLYIFLLIVVNNKFVVMFWYKTAYKCPRMENIDLIRKASTCNHVPNAFQLLCLIPLKNESTFSLTYFKLLCCVGKIMWLWLRLFNKELSSQYFLCSWCGSNLFLFVLPSM